MTHKKSAMINPHRDLRTSAKKKCKERGEKSRLGRVRKQEEEKEG
jgi:hypothetical protein